MEKVDSLSTSSVYLKNRVLESGSRISINPKLNSWISRIIDDVNAPDDLRSSLQRLLENSPATRRSIPVTTVQQIACHASSRREPGKTPKSKLAYLDEFFLGAKWYFAEGDAPAKRNFDEESPVEKIRNDAAAREYARMTKNVDPGRAAANKGESFAADLRVANKESLAVINCLLTVIGAFVFGYFATGYAVGNNVVAQVLVALVLSTIVAIADIYFLLRKLYAAEQGLDESTRELQHRRSLNAGSKPSQKSKDD